MRDRYQAKRIAKRIVAEATLAIPPSAKRLPDNDQWTNRFEIRSESSNRVYIIAQHKAKGHWGCSCPAWRTRRKCKHLKSLGLPELEQPHQVTIASRLLLAQGADPDSEETNPGIHPIYCEQCGEDEAEVTLKHANLCGDCAANTLRHELENVFPFSVCGQPLFANGRLTAVCVMKYGEEHDHSRLG